MKNIFYVLLLFSTALFSQKGSANDSLLNSDYFNEVQQEKFFIHTNKTIYFSGEKIYWKAYVVDDFTNKPLPATTNLYVNLYDSKKELMSHQLFFCNIGTAYGKINLPQKIKTGKYYIQLDTQWNKNFKKKYITEVNVVNTKQANVKPEKVSTKNVSLEAVSITSKNDIEIKFYPESGLLLDDEVNTVFLTLKNNKKYVANSIVKIVDNTTGIAIAKLKTNTFGAGIFKIACQPNHNYSAIVNYKNKTHFFKLNVAQKTGVIIHKISSLGAGTQKFLLNFTKNLIEQYNGSTFFATIHRNNKLRYVLPVKVTKQHHKYVLNFSKENLFNGVNTITLFTSKNDPIATRSFFVKTKDKIALELLKKTEEGDSIMLSFKLKNSFTNANLSVSVLPKMTKLNTCNTSIEDAFLINPYIGKSIKTDVKYSAMSDIDIFLQCQPVKLRSSGSQHDTLKFNTERGLTIKGVVNTPVKNNYKVLLSSKSNGILQVTGINVDKSFVFKNLMLEDKSDYRLALLDNTGVLIKAGFYVYKNNNKYKADTLLTHQPTTINNVETTKIEITSVNEQIHYKGTELLKEIVLHGIGKKTIEEEKALYPNTPKELGNGFSRKIKIDDGDELLYTVVELLSNTPGIKAFEAAGGVSIKIDRATKDSFYGGEEALILIDGFPTQASALYKMSVSEVSSMTVNKTGAGYGMRGGNGVISIKLKGGGVVEEIKPNKNYFLSKVDFGFTKTTSNFEPSVFVFNTPISQKYYETLDWIPEFRLAPNKLNTLKIHKGNHKQIKLIINGMNTEGQLIYSMINISF